MPSAFARLYAPLTPAAKCPHEQASFQRCRTILAQQSEANLLWGSGLCVFMFTTLLGRDELWCHETTRPGRVAVGERLLYQCAARATQWSCDTKGETSWQARARPRANDAVWRQPSVEGFSSMHPPNQAPMPVFGNLRRAH